MFLLGPSLLGTEFVRGPVCQGPSWSGAKMSRNQQELSNLDYYFQDGGKSGAQTHQSFQNQKTYFDGLRCHNYYKRLKFYDKIIFWSDCICFAILRAVSAYVGEN